MDKSPCRHNVNHKSPAHIKNRIKPRVYVRHITRSKMYNKRLDFVGTSVRKISSVASGFSPIKIHFSDYLKSLINRIDEAAITLVIVLAWFLWRQYHLMERQRHVIKVDPECTSEV